MNEDRLWLLVARHLAEEASVSEAEELQLLLKQNPDKQYLADIIGTYFKAHSSETEPENEGIDFDQRLRRIMKTDRPGDGSGAYAIPENGSRNKKPFFRLNRLLPYAAAITSIGFTVWLVYRSTKPPAVRPANPDARTSQVVSRPGVRPKLVLPDGTQVWLNSGSKLHYKNDFDKSIREVSLEGEAFFDVVKEVDHPFIVHTSAINVRVLGTAFNVKSYPRD
ncbi:MAG TPA: FecR family protein, partial [Puia sp.]